MTARVFSATAVGFDGCLIEVECDSTNGLPSLQIVGLGNKAIDEAKERVRSAIKNAGFSFPAKRITINLAPADLPKDGSHFDLPIALAILIISDQLKPHDIDNMLFAGELALDGGVRSIKGIINIAETTKACGIETIVIPKANAKQAALITDLKVIGVDTLSDLFMHLKKELEIEPTEQGQLPVINSASSIKLEHIYGQDQAKRGLMIAAAGHHNILFDGPPGAGKTMLAKSLLSILPELTDQEVIEVTKLHNLAGEANQEVILNRPFRSPHHTASHISIIGGGHKANPGEISMSHRGVLFLDELPEYPRQSLEALRQPLEDKQIHVARANQRVVYPADFMLIATKNPCPCGFAGDLKKECSCTLSQINNYQKKVSGPLLDRIDIVLPVTRVDHKNLLNDQHNGLASNDVRKTINKVRVLQSQRYNSPLKTNATLSNQDIKRHVRLSDDVKQFLDQASSKLHLSARAYFKVIKVARTIADIEDKTDIGIPHLTEALQYRIR